MLYDGRRLNFPSLNRLIKNWFSKEEIRSETRFESRRVPWMNIRKLSVYFSSAFHHLLLTKYPQTFMQERFKGTREEGRLKGISSFLTKIYIHERDWWSWKFFLLRWNFSFFFFISSYRRNACSCPTQSYIEDESSCPTIRIFDNNVYCCNAHIRKHPPDVTELSMCNKTQLTYI